MLTIIYGPSGSGKTRSTRNLDEKCLYIDPLCKNRFTMKCEQKSGLMTYSEIAKAIAETDKDTIIVDDVSILVYDELNSRCDEKGYDKYSDIAGSIYKLLKFARQFTDRHIILMMPSQTDTFGFENIALGGMLIAEKVPFAMMSDNIYKTIIREGDYKLLLKNTGNDLTKDSIMLCEAIECDLTAFVNKVREILTPKEKGQETPLKQAREHSNAELTKEVIQQTIEQAATQSQERVRRVRR